MKEQRVRWREEPADQPAVSVALLRPICVRKHHNATTNFPVLSFHQHSDDGWADTGLGGLKEQKKQSAVRVLLSWTQVKSINMGFNTS